MSGSGRKSKSQDNVFEQIREQLKADNTLSSTEIRQKLDAQGIKVSDSSIIRILKIRKYAYMQTKYWDNDFECSSKED